MTIATENQTSATTSGVAELEPNEFRVADVPPGSAIRLGDVAVFNVGGSLCATQARCTHKQGPLNEGTLEGSTVTCPYHGAQFNVCTGALLRGPAMQPLETYQIRVENGIGESSSAWRSDVRESAALSIRGRLTAPLSGDAGLSLTSALADFVRYPLRHGRAVTVDLETSIPPRGIERYEIERELGEGGAAAVFLARDRETGEAVALKKLFRMDAKSVLRLKREFRSLARMNHPNLVKLYDLGRADDGWFLTMEYIAGADLASYVSGDGGSIATNQAPKISYAPERTHASEWLWAFRQLAQGVRALHRAGMLHRDLKPSNVLVANDRVVILDFGLVREIDPAAAVTLDRMISGTPAYMAPEQARGDELGEATDWYAFGVMLYEALSGALPFEGTLLEILEGKITRDPRPVSELAEVPEPLTQLCSALLARDPRSRPNGDAVLAALEPLIAAPRLLARDAGSIDPSLKPSAASLFGRAAELAELWRNLTLAEQGRAVVVHVRGESGAGKSALIERFLDEVERRPKDPTRGDTLVLRSRCYEREAIPFKALDGLIDALVHHLERLDDMRLGRLMPADVTALVQLFPVLERVPALRRLMSEPTATADRIQDRKRAEAALSELFMRLAAFETLVVSIDDLHWGDLDSANVLCGWLQQLAQVPLLLVFSYRADEVQTSPCLRQLLAAREHDGAVRAHETVLAIEPLPSADVRQIFTQRLGALAQDHAAAIDRMVHEAQGSPFLASQLAALAGARIARGDTQLDAPSIDAFVTQTGALLPPGANELLCVLAVAARPLAPKLALKAAGVLREGPAVLHALRSLNLVRRRDVGTGYLIEVYHDRVRERVYGLLDQAQRERVYASLFDVVSQTEDADPAWLHVLALGSNRRAAALRHAMLAADRAFASLAFERAAELYRTCLELDGAADADRGGLWTKLAQALACSCHGVAAAEAYQEAAKRAPPAEALVLTRLAASHFLRSGRFTEGETLVRQVLAAKNLSLPESDAGLLAAIVWERARLSVRGLGYRERAEHEVPAHVLEQIDLIDTFSLETQTFDPLRAALLQLRGMRWALDSGEPKRVARALGSAANMIAMSGTRGAADEVDALLKRAGELTQRLGDAREQAAHHGFRAISAFMLGRAAEVIEPAYEAERLFRASSSADLHGDYYLRFAVVSSRIGALSTLGDQRKFRAELDAVLAEARATDNRTALLQCVLNETAADEIDGRPEASRERLERQFLELPQGRFGILHLLHLIAVMRFASCTRDYAWADRFIEPHWRGYRRSPVSRVAFLAYGVHGSRARLLLNRHVHEQQRGDPARLVQDDVRALERLALPLSKPLAARMLARVALLSGERARAAEHFRESIAQWQATASRDEAARDRWALGSTLGGAEGAKLTAAAEHALADAGLKQPQLDVTFHFPELSDR